jgi:hypothetical protein
MTKELSPHCPAATSLRLIALYLAPLGGVSFQRPAQIDAGAISNCPVDTETPTAAVRAIGA